MEKVKKLPAWSFSSLSTFEQCPIKWKARYVDKTYKEPPQPHLEHGVRCHKDLEDRIKDGKPLPDDLKNIEPYLVALERLPVKTTLVEHQLGLTEGRTPTGFFAKDTWYRGVVDAAFVCEDSAVVLDHKMGKRKRDFTQLELFAHALMVHRPEVKRVKMIFGWWKYLNETGKPKENPELKVFDTQDTTAEQSPVFWQKMLPRIERMSYAYNNDHYFEKPGPLCGWCYHSACKHCPNK